MLGPLGADVIAPEYHAVSGALLDPLMFPPKESPPAPGWPMTMSVRVNSIRPDRSSTPFSSIEGRIGGGTNDCASATSAPKETRQDSDERAGPRGKLSYHFLFPLYRR